MSTQYIFINGSIVPAAEAVISPFDIGLLRGYAVFDLLRTVNGRPFLLGEHLRRLRASADHLKLRVPFSDEEISAAVDELLERNGHEEATVRFVLTGGISPDGMKYDPATPTFFILTHDLHEPASSVYEVGAKLTTEQYARECPEAKTTNYLKMLRHRERIAEEDALDLLYHDGVLISEAATASFYIVRGGTIYAPDEGVLAGTIGSFVLELAEGRHPVELGEVTLEEAFDADEAFLTSTTRGIVPIVQLDDRPIGDGTVGPVTQDLMAAYRAAVFGE